MDAMKEQEQNNVRGVGSKEEYTDGKMEKGKDLKMKIRSGKEHGNV